MQAKFSKHICYQNITIKIYNKLKSIHTNAQWQEILPHAKFLFFLISKTLMLHISMYISWIACIKHYMQQNIFTKHTQSGVDLRFFMRWWWCCFWHLQSLKFGTKLEIYLEPQGNMAWPATRLNMYVYVVIAGDSLNLTDSCINMFEMVGRISCHWALMG